MQYSRTFLALLVLFALPVVGCLSMQKRHTPVSHAPSPSSSSETSVGLRFRQDVVTYAQKYIGTGYKAAGTSPKTGFDCSGFTQYVLKEFDIKISPASSKQATEGRAVPLDRVQPGDLIIFGHDGYISHVGMVVKRSKDGIYVVHSTNSRGVVVDNVSVSNYWKPKILYARDVISKG